MIPSTPEQQQQQRRSSKRVRFPSADFTHVAHVDFVSKEDRSDYWYTPAEYSVIEREIKQTVRRLRKRVAAEMKLERCGSTCNSDFVVAKSVPTIPATSSSSTSTDSVAPTCNKRQRLHLHQQLHYLDTTKYCDRGLEDFVHHYETKQLKATIAKVILAEQEIQRARGIQDPVALMQLSMACTQLSRQQAISLAEQDAEDVLRIHHQEVQTYSNGNSINNDTEPQLVVDNNNTDGNDAAACRFLFSNDMTKICNDITKSTSLSNDIVKPMQHQHVRPITLLSLCDPLPQQPNLIRSDTPISSMI